MPASFSLPAVDDFRLFNGDFSYRIVVPSGASQLEVRLVTTTPDVDVDLYVRFGRDVSNSLDLDYSSEGLTGDETVTITASSDPPLAPGTYYIALGVFYSETTVMGTVTATVSTGPAGTGGGGPVAWWKFDEGSGLTAADSSGNSNTGTLVNGPTWTAGKLGGALSFDGVDDFVSGSNAGNGFPRGDAARTISAWIKAARSNGVDWNILHYGTDTDSQASAQFALYLRGNGRPAFGVGPVSGVVAATSRIDDENWHYVAGVYEGFPPYRARIFVDGVQEATFNLSPPPNTGAASNWAIGRFMNGGGPFRGVIDDVRLYSRALSGAEIEALFVAGGGPPRRPVLSVAESLMFGALPLGRTRDMALAVRNSGSAALTVTGVSTSHSDFKFMSPSLPFTVNGLASREIIVRFQPSMPGDQVGSLVITSDDPARPTASVALSGRGEPPPIAVSPASLTFSARRGSNPPPQTFTVRGTEAGTLHFVVTTSQPWLSASPSRGISAGSPASVTVSINTAGLGIGAYTAEIRISETTGVAAGLPEASQAGPVVVPVRLSVTAEGPSEAVVVNAASFTRSVLPGGAIARGSMFTMFGTGLGPPNPVAATVPPLPPALGGVSVRATGDSYSVDALPLAVAANQINAILPSNAPLGEVTIVAAFNGRPTGAAVVRVVDAGFGIFTVNQNGMGPGLLQNFVSPAEQPINSSLRPARPGDLVTLWGTGLGPVSGPDNIPPGRRDLPVTAILVGGKLAANTVYSGRAPCCAGLDQIVFEVPADAPEGCFVPVLVRAGNLNSNAVTMAIARDGLPCSDPANPFGRIALQGGKQGLFSLRRVSVRAQPGPAAPLTNFTVDLASASFTEERGSEFSFDPITSLPPVGSCSVFTARGVDLDGVLRGQLPSIPATGRALDAGTSLTVSGLAGTRAIARSTDGSGGYFDFLGGTVPGRPSLPLFLEPGSYTVTGPGGRDVGAFTAGPAVPPQVRWVNREMLATVDRGLGATLIWTGGDPSRQIMTILGWNTDLRTSVAGAFICAALVESGGFHVPPVILSTLPSSSLQQTGQSSGFLFLGVSPARDVPTFSAPGLDAGWAYFSSLEGTAVNYR